MPQVPGHAERGPQGWDGGYGGLLTRCGVGVLERTPFETLRNLLVGNFETNTVSRFLIDAQGNATSNGTITGNGLSSPAGLALAPWGELFVSNENVRTISRFTFDSTHQAIANGVFSVPSAQDLDRIRIFRAPLQ